MPLDGCDIRIFNEKPGKSLRGRDFLTKVFNLLNYKLGRLSLGETISYISPVRIYPRSCILYVWVQISIADTNQTAKPLEIIISMGMIRIDFKFYTTSPSPRGNRMVDE